MALSTADHCNKDEFGDGWYLVSLTVLCFGGPPHPLFPMLASALGGEKKKERKQGKDDARFVGGSISHRVPCACIALPTALYLCETREPYYTRR